jgi:hypothetical protein
MIEAATGAHLDLASAARATAAANSRREIPRRASGEFPRCETCASRRQTRRRRWNPASRFPRRCADRAKCGRFPRPTRPRCNPRCCDSFRNTKAFVARHEIWARPRRWPSGARRARPATGCLITCGGSSPFIVSMHPRRAHRPDRPVFPQAIARSRNAHARHGVRSRRQLIQAEPRQRSRLNRPHGKRATSKSRAGFQPVGFRNALAVTQQKSDRLQACPTFPARSATRIIAPQWRRFRPPYPLPDLPQTEMRGPGRRRRRNLQRQSGRSPAPAARDSSRRMSGVGGSLSVKANEGSSALTENTQMSAVTPYPVAGS